MRHSEAVEWIDAMLEAVCVAQGVVLQSLRRQGVKLDRLTPIERAVISDTNKHLFNGPPDPDYGGLGRGLLNGLEKVLDRVRAGGTMTKLEFFNFAFLFNAHPQLGISLVSVAHQRGNKPPLTIDGLPVYDLPELDATWLRDAWTPEEECL